MNDPTTPTTYEAGVRHSPEFAALAKSLVAAQADLPTVTKDAVNPHFKNRYASLDAVVEAVRGPLAKHGLAVVQGAASPNGEAALTVETLLVHSSGEWLSNTVVVPMTKIDAQGAGATLTYGRRYGLSALLSLATEEDDDANAATAKPAAVPPKRAPAKPALQEQKAGPGQVADVWALIGAVVKGGAPRREIDAGMQKVYGTTDPNELTRAQAHDFIARLKKLRDGVAG